MPNSFCETPDGYLLAADGLGPVLVWDGFWPQARQAGVPKPLTPITVAGAAVGFGRIVGTYTAYVRYLDDRGLVGDLSPVSAEATISVASGGVVGATTTSPIRLTLPAHGLTNAARIKVKDVVGQAGANGTWDIVVIDANTVQLTDSTSSGDYVSGGTWTAGAAGVRYSNIPATDDPRVRRKQILRNTDGQAQTYYVDIDTNDLSATSATSISTDEFLQAQEAAVLVDADGKDLANLHAEPPQHKPVLLAHQGRVLYAGEVEYTEGAVALTFGSKVVQGVGTEWTHAMAGRSLFVVGSDRRYEIDACDVSDQQLFLTEAYAGATTPYSLYAVKPQPGEERLVYWSEAGLPESVPVLNSIQLPDNGDKVATLISKDSFVYIVERRHTHKFTFQNDPSSTEPGGDGFIFPAAARGCVNDRCIVLAESGAYMLDEDGIHVFDKGKSDNGSISTPIQTLFRPDGLRGDSRINWNASRFFHAAHDPSTETIRWFVALSGQLYPRHAICYQYTLERWWLEEYPFPITSSCVGKLHRTAPLAAWGFGRVQVYLGSRHRKVLALGAGPLDGPDHQAGPTSGRVVSATRRSVTGAETFAADAVGSPVVITSGRGAGQRRVVVSASGATLNVRQPWSVTPDSTSAYQLGGIPWQYQTGWFRWAESENSNERRVELNFEPTESAQKMYLRRYRDRSRTPMLPTVSRNDDGVKVTAGVGDLEVSLDRPTGFAQTRIEGGRELYTHGPRQISVGLSGYGGVEPTRVYQINIDGVK